VLTGDRELGCREGGTLRYRAKRRYRLRFAGDGGAKQLTGLAAKLVNVSALGKFRHDVSSEPRFAFRPAKKTKIVGKTTGTERRTLVLPANPGAPS
jgi:hypothetical protein